jgi:hypothetical protein
MEEILLLGFIFLFGFLIYQSNRFKKQHLLQSKLLQKEIEDIESKKNLIEEINASTSIPSQHVSQIANQVLDLHQLIISKYLK